MYVLKEVSRPNSRVLAFSPDLFHQAHALQLNTVHIEGDGFSFDLEKINNADYNPTYFTDRWKGQSAYLPYEFYDEHTKSSLFLPFLRMYSQFFISEVNEYTVVLTGLILKYTRSDIFITDDRIAWFHDPDKRLHIVNSFPEKNAKTLTINGLEQDLVFDMQFKTMGPIGAFHNVFFLQGHGVMHLERYKYANIVFDEEAGIGSVLNTLNKCATAMREIGLELISIEKALGQFDSSVLEKYFDFNLEHEGATMHNTVFFPQIAALKSTAFIYLTEAEVDLRVLKKSFLDEMDEYASAVIGNKRVLGVLMRGTDYINMFKSGIRLMSSPEEMVPMIDEWMKTYDYNEIFLATEDGDILEWMKKYYKGRLLAISQERHSVNDLQGHLLLADLVRNRVRDRIKGLLGDRIRDSVEETAKELEESIVNYFYALYMLSKCKAFICSGYCNGYDLVIHFNNNKFEHVYLFQKGENK